ERSLGSSGSRMLPFGSGTAPQPNVSLKLSASRASVASACGLIFMRDGSLQTRTAPMANVTTLPPRDPIFALAPELQLRQSTLAGQLVGNSREVARVFLRDDHPALIQHIMWSISSDRSVWPQWQDEFRMRADGTVDITSRGLLSALNHWGFDYEE